MASQVTLKALGLNYSPNNLALPEGSLLVANDVIVRRDNVVESRRGFKDYSESLGISTSPIKQLLQYKDRILTHYFNPISGGNKIAYDTQTTNEYGQNIFEDFPGIFNETQTGLRIKSIIANKNLYFTSDEGIKKLSAKSASDFPNSEIVNSGGVKALDVSANLNIKQGQLTGFFPVDSTVAYRVLWGYKDANSNLIYGTPSERTVVYNYLSDIIPLDFNTLLNDIDGFGQTLSISNISFSSPAEITTTIDHGLTTNDIVHIKGTNTTNSTIGSFQVTVTGSNKFTIPVSVTSGTFSSGTLTKSLITDSNYYQTYKLAIVDSAETFKTNVLGLAEKLDKDILYADLGTTPGTAPLTIDSLQVNVGSVGQINFPITQDPKLFFNQNDYIEIEGFGSEPETTTLALTNVGGTSLFPENPVTITTTPNTLVNNREITISGTTTLQSVNGTYAATVENKTISSTSGGGKLGGTGPSTVTVINGANNAEKTIQTTSLGGAANIQIASGTTPYTITNVQNITRTGSISILNLAGVYFYLITIDSTANLQNGDEVKFSGVTPDPNGPISNNTIYTVASLNVFGPNTFVIGSYSLSSSYSDPSITITISAATFTTNVNHTIASGDIINISGSSITYESTSASINGDLTVTSSTRGTNTFIQESSKILNIVSPYGTATPYLKFKSIGMISSGTLSGTFPSNTLIKITGVESTPKIYNNTSNIDESTYLYVNSLSGSEFYVSFTSGGTKILPSNAGYINGLTSALMYKSIQITTTANHNFVDGKLIEISVSTSSVPAGALNGTYRVYSPSGTTFRIIPSTYLTTAATDGTIRECTQFQSNAHGLSDGNMIYIANDAIITNISSISAGMPTTTITTISNHGLPSGTSLVTINDVSQSGGTTISGEQTVTYIDATSFSIATGSTPTGLSYSNASITYTPAFQSSPTLSGRYYVQEADTNDFYISLLNPNTGIDLVTTTETIGNPDIYLPLTVEVLSPDTITTFDENNWITISDCNVTELNSTWKIASIIDTTKFTILPYNATSYSSGTTGKVTRVTIPVSVDSVTIGTGSVKTTVGKNLKQFNGNWQITSVVSPDITTSTKGYIQFIFSTTPDTFTAEIPNPSTTKDANAKIYSYDYRKIVNSSDINYSTTLNDLQVSAIATSEQLRIIQNNISRIANKLKTENSGVIQSGLINGYIKDYSITIAGNVDLELTVPAGITKDYFYQIYRTRVFTAEGIQTLGSLGDVPITADDEMNLVYEGFPPYSESIPHFPTSISYTDTYPEDLALTNENLYTNPVTGQGILQANDTPPFAKDINVFKNCTFFANTQTKQRLNPFQLIGTINIGTINNDKITISDSTGNNSITYLFNPGVNQQIEAQFTKTDSAATIKSNIQNRYVIFYTPYNKYYAWFRYDNKDITFSGVVPSSGITTFTTNGDHNLENLSKIYISGLTSTTDINGEQTVTVTGTNTFTIPVNCGTITTSSLTSAKAIPYVSDATEIKVNLFTGDIATTCSTKFANNVGSAANEFTTSNSIGISQVVAGTPNTTITTEFEHNLVAGDIINISGVTQSSGTTINGLKTIVATPTSTSFTIATGSLPQGLIYSSAFINVYYTYITNVDEGMADNASTNVLGSITLSRPIIGQGEDASATPFPKVLLSQTGTTSQSIDVTARSLVRVINKQTNSPVYAYYVSGEDTSPGIINIEAKSLTTPKFYILGSGESIGQSFNPDISAENTVTSITGTLGGHVYTLTANAHGLVNDDQIIISGSNCSPNIDGVYSVNNCTTNTFEITSTSAYISSGTYAAYSSLTNAVSSVDEQKQNRVYYSKLNQPEAVPILNYFDIGSSDKAILRIIPIRDSLFVFKEDGLYRISGEEAPFVVTLFDSSCIVAAPDSVSISNNIIYGWTVKGISNISESGVAEISRPIDTEILKLGSSRYPNFKTATWGVGYDSDNSYTVFTNSDPTDEFATIGFRYSDLTNTWTNIKRSQNCGIIFSTDDKMYTAGSEDTIIYQERKNFDRTDYSDSDFNISIDVNSVKSATNKTLGTRIYFQDVKNIAVGDVITQTQILTDYLFNSLLDKLDLDPNVGVVDILSSSGTSSTITITTDGNHYLNNNDYVNLSNTNSFPVLDGTYKVFNVTSNTFDITVTNLLITQATQGKAKRNYYETLNAKTGDSLRNKIVELASYLDTDPGLTSNNYSSFVQNYSGLVVSNSANTQTVITTAAPQGLVEGRLVTFSGTDNNSIPTLLNKTFEVITDDSTHFKIPLKVTTAGGLGLSYDTSVNQLDIYDIKACFNAIIEELNIDSAKFTDYKPVSELNLLEAVVVDVNYVYNFIDVNLPLPWTNGQATIYKSIPCEIVYAPITFGDPLSIKQIYEATMMFDNKAFTKATAAFNTDLKPEFLPVDFYGQGNGIFGHYSDPGFGYGFFGGLSNSAPFRTIIPREAQRCRFLTVKFQHQIGREKWALNGITLTGNMGLSSRGYR